jgi:hypothetical protein
MAEKDILQREIDDNLAFFETKVDDLIHDHRDRYALLRHKKVIGIYDTLRDAKVAGDNQFTDGIFSIQKITKKSVDLGVFSHAMHLGDTQ